MDKYDLNHRKLIQRPFMTLNVFLVGKFHKNIDILSESKEKHILYRNDDDDPGICETRDRNDDEVYQNKFKENCSKSICLINAK